MKYTKQLDELLRQRIALQHSLDELDAGRRGNLRQAADVRRELRGVDQAIETLIVGPS